MSRAAWKLGSAFGIPVYVHWSFLLLPLLVLFGSLGGGLPSVLFAQVLLLSVFGCVVLHELGHALMARVFGIATRDITLYPIGGVARLDGTGDRPHEEICIALAGPAVNLFLVILLSPLVVLALVSGLLAGGPAFLAETTPTGAIAGPLGVIASYLTALWIANGVLLLFNLIPAFPMDGGRVLRAGLASGLGQLRATEIAATVGLFLAGGLAIVGLLMGQVGLFLVSLFVAFAGQAELFALRQRALAEQRRRLAASPVVTLLEEGRPTHQVVLGGFTGFLWDNRNGVWVRWVNGQPVDGR